jgi:hypothetical protein
MFSEHTAGLIDDEQQADHDYPETVEVEHHLPAEMYQKKLLHLPLSAHESGLARCCRSSDDLDKQPPFDNR